MIWGALNGLYVLAGGMLPAVRVRWLRVTVTFCLTCFAWIFFRAKTLADAVYIAGHLFGHARHAAETLALFGRVNLLIIAALVLLMELMHLLQERGGVRAFISRQPAWVRWPFYYAAAILILMFGVFDGPQAFIYFQF